MRAVRKRFTYAASISNIYEVRSDSSNSEKDLLKPFEDISLLRNKPEHVSNVSDFSTGSYCDDKDDDRFGGLLRHVQCSVEETAAFKATN